MQKLNLEQAFATLIPDFIYQFLSNGHVDRESINCLALEDLRDAMKRTKEPEYEGVISDTLVRHVAKGGRLVMTSAPPGQPGYNHFNCQPLKYWRDRMETRGLEYSNVDTRKLVEVWGHTFMATHWLENNLQVFYRP